MVLTIALLRTPEAGSGFGRRWAPLSRHPALLRHDSPLEGNGFEPSVPREIGLRSGSVNRRQTGRRRSDHGDTAMAVGAVDESCRLNRGNLNILSEARIHAPELIGYQVSVDPI